MVDNRKELKPGSFYWVRPNWDTDLVPQGFEGKEFSDEMFAAMESHWSQNEQPALFVGYGLGDEERWSFIGQDDPDDGSWWSACWVGSEITILKEKPHDRRLGHPCA